VAEAARRAGLSNPALIIVGEVVSLRGPLSWFEASPLFGRRLLVPRPPHQAGETAEAIRRRAAEPIILSAIEIGPPPDPAALVAAARRVGQYDYCLFTSSNGVRAFFQALREAGLDARAFGRCRVGAIGPRTAQSLAPHGVVPDLVASEYVGEALARELLTQPGLGRVLVPRALVAREELPRLLSEAGVSVDVVPAYATRPAGSERRELLRALIEERGLDAILFSSSSMVDAIVELLGDDARRLLPRVALASIGPITSASLARHGLSADVTAEHYTEYSKPESTPTRHLSAPTNSAH
jgi:uroporphyrinogen III methyltransferase/synthase